VNPYVFIVGCPRSGTTLLKRVVDAHPEIAITRETHWVTKLLRGRDAASVEAPVTRALLARLLADERFQRLALDPAPLERLVSGDRPVSYGELVTAVYDQHGTKQGKLLVGDKTPRYVRHIPVLHELFPHARFIHLIRDGRDVCSSVLSWHNDRGRRAVTRHSTWEDEPVMTTAVWWEQRVRLGREAGAALGPELYHELLYESLMSAPARECATICAFLGVPEDDRMLGFHEGRTRDEPNLDAKRAWRPITAGLRSWRTEMSETDLHAFEAVSGDLLDELGYSRGAPDPGPEFRRRAAAVRESFAREVGDRRLPAGWR
jgi:hypothetical protein